jgi:hypothetical protein
MQMKVGKAVHNQTEQIKDYGTAEHMPEKRLLRGALRTP